MSFYLSTSFQVFTEMSNKLGPTLGLQRKPPHALDPILCRPFESEEVRAHVWLWAVDSEYTQQLSRVRATFFAFEGRHCPCLSMRVILFKELICAFERIHTSIKIHISFHKDVQRVLRMWKLWNFLTWDFSLYSCLTRGVNRARTTLRTRALSGQRWGTVRPATDLLQSLIYFYTFLVTSVEC